MWILFFTILLVIFLNFLYSLIFIDEQKRGKWLCVSVCLVLIVLSSLRSIHTGADFINYAGQYEYIGRHSWTDLFHTRWEPGYMVLNKLMAYVSSDTLFFALVTSSISIVGFGSFIHKYSNTVWLSFVVFITMGFYASTFNILRQTFAMIVVLYAIKFLVNANLRKYLCCVLVACLFHYSAMFALFLYPFCRLKINIYYYLIFLLGCFLLFNVLGKVILSYLLANVFSTLDLKSNTMGVNMLILLVFLSIATLYLANMDDPQENVFVHMLIFASLLQVLALQYSMVSRVVLYYTTSLIILLPNMLKRVRLDYLGRFSLYGISVCCLLAYWFYLTVQQQASGTVIFEFGKYFD